MNFKKFYTGKAIGFVALAAILLGVFALGNITPSPTTAEPSEPPPSWANADQVIVKDAHPRTLPPAGYQAFRDLRHSVTFNAPIDWKPQVIPEGTGQPSMVSPDFADPFGNMQGAYMSYSSASLPDGFTDRPAEYFASLKQGMTWSDTTLDGHAAYITKMDNGYAMVVSQFSDNWFVTLSFFDPGKKYGAAFDELIRSYHAQ